MNLFSKMFPFHDRFKQSDIYFFMAGSHNVLFIIHDRVKQRVAHIP